MKFIIYSINLLLTLALFSAPCGLAMTKEELQAQTEAFIRQERQRKKRLQSDVLLDNRGHLYYDGEKMHPGMVIHGNIYPAVIQSGYRQPGCLLNGEIIAGNYVAAEDRIVCRISTLSVTTQVGQGVNASRAEAPAPNPQPIADKKPGPVTKPPPKRIARPPARPKKRAPQKKQFAAAKQAPVMELNPFRAKQKFGIRAGSWARVLLPRSVSSSEPADIELELLDDLVGAHKTLPAGTVFFTRHRVNAATQRLDMEISLMVLPDGKEHRVVGTVHGLNKMAGLAGAVITHNERVADISARTSVLGAAQRELDQTTSSNSAARIAGGVASEVLDANKRAVAPVPTFSVQVAAQEALLRFGRSF